MIPTDEQYVIKWLSQYGALTKTQVTRMLKDKSTKTAEKIIRNLKRSMRISEIAGGYYLAIDNMCQPDQRIITAAWILLKYINQVEPLAHYPASYPSQLFFLKEDVGYEVVVLYEGEDHLMKLLQPQDDLKYILVVPHLMMASQLRLPRAPCLFATVDYAGQEEPTVKFFKEEDIHARTSKGIV